MWSSWVQDNSDGPLVPMVRLVPMEKHPIPMVWLGTGQFQWSIGTNGTIGTNGKAPYSGGSIGEYASH